VLIIVMTQAACVIVQWPPSLTALPLTASSCCSQSQPPALAQHLRTLALAVGVDTHVPCADTPKTQSSSNSVTHSATDTHCA